MKPYFGVACTVFGMLALNPAAQAVQTGSDQITTELESVVVTATRTEHTLEDVPEATTVITAKELKLQNAGNALEAIRWIPGMNVSLGYGAHGGDGYKIDGADSSYVLVLVDGNRGKGKYILSEIPVSMIERIEVIKGANSLLYGSDAMSGVINIITKQGSDKFTASIQGTYTSADENANTQEVTAGFSVGKLRQVYSYKREENNLGDYQGDSFMGKFGVDLGEQFALGFDVKANQFDMDFVSTDKYDFHLNFGWNIDDKGSLKAKLFVQDYEDKIQVMRDKYTIDSLYNEQELVYTRLLGNSHLITAGYQRMEDDVDYKAPTKEYSGSRYSNNIFFQDEISFNDTFIVVPAVRMDFHSLWDDQVNPKLSVLWKATDTLSLRASFGTAFRAPSSKELYRRFNHPGRQPFWVLGNPDLQPEESTTMRFNVRKRIGENFIGTLEFFRNDFDDKIQIVPVPASIDRTYANVSEAMSQGFSAEMKYYVTDNLMAALGYTYLDTENKDTGKTLPYTVRHRLTPRVRYNNEAMGLTAQISGDYEDHATLSGIPRRDRGQDKEVFILNASVSKQITDYVKVWINGENLLDKETVDGLSRDGLRVTFGLRFNY